MVIHSDHMAPTPATFDFGRLTFGTTPMTNRAGGRYVQVAYAGAQVEYQLGSAQQPLRCPFGAELAAARCAAATFVLHFVELPT